MIALASAGAASGGWAQGPAEALGAWPVPALPVVSGPALQDAGDRVPFDLAIARRARAAGLQASSIANGVASAIEFAAFPGGLLVAGALFGIGELDDRPAARELGLRMGGAVVAAGAISGVGKVALGRARPMASPDDPYQVDFGRGFEGDAYQSFPSAHTAMAFAAATVLSADLLERDSPAAAWAIPGLYAIATLAGLSRIYNDEHWTTDVIAGAVVGLLSGWGAWEVRN